MTADPRSPLPIRVARALARTVVPTSFWSVVDEGLRSEIETRRSKGGRAPDLWGAFQYAGVAVRFALERVVGDRVTSGFTGLLTTSGLAIDARAALRSVRSRPGAGVTIVGTIALAVGASTALFSVVHGVLLQPLPYPEADRLARVWQTRPDWVDAPNSALNAIAENLNVNYPTLEDWLSTDTGFEHLGAWVDAGFVLEGAAGAEVLRGQEATSGFFTALGIQPLIGRTLSTADDQAGAELVVVLSEGIWRNRFQGRSSALGTSIVLNGLPHTVIGVMPDVFPGPTGAAYAEMLPGDRPLLWTPLTDEARRGWKSVMVVGRLAPGVSVGDVDDRLSGLHAELAPSYPEAEARRGVRVEGLLTSVVSEVRATLWFLLGAVGLVMLVAIVNIANVQVASGLTRRRDLAVRAAIGADTGRLVRGLVLESGILTVVGGVGGVALAWAGMPLLLRLLPATLPRLDQVGMNGAVIVGGLALTGATALLVGTLPALLAAGADPQDAMRESTRGATANRSAVRLRSGLVVVQIGLATVLLIGAGLLANSFLRLWNVDRGFDTRGVVAVWIEPDRAEFADREARERFRTMLEDGLESIPGVRAAAANNVPLSGLTSGTNFVIERRDGSADTTSALLSVGTPDLLEVLGLALLAGRGFSDADGAGAPQVGLVNATMAERYWPGSNPIGESFLAPGDVDTPIEIIGVVADVPATGLAAPVDPMVLLPAAQLNRSTYEWVLRTEGDPATVVAETRRIVREVSPSTPITRVLILDEAIDESVAVPRVRMVLVLSLALLAALLGLVGVYGVLSFVVAQRRREIGVRMALGAHAGRVVKDVLRQGLQLTLIGTVAGLSAAWLLSDLARGFLFEIAPRHLLTYAAVAVTVVALGCLAAWAPARRATRVDPVEVLTGG